MSINRRRAPSSKVSSEKKLDGHKREFKYARLLGGKTLGGTIKRDVEDKHGNFHSVKGGKKWQIFLYRENKIESSRYLNILLPCLNAFTANPTQYFQDRTKCISFKETYISKHGRAKAKDLSNEIISQHLGVNSYMRSKEKLALTTKAVSDKLCNPSFLRCFLAEAIFNNDEVLYLAVEDSTLRKDMLFKVFMREDVLDILARKLYPSVSKAGLTPSDYNVGGQKTLLRYVDGRNNDKNIVEIEIRNDSEQHYREVRFNMYSKDTLYLLLSELDQISTKKPCDGMILYGKAIDMLL
jgi:hypothetical protein